MILNIEVLHFFTEILISLMGNKVATNICIKYFMTYPILPHKVVYTVSELYQQLLLECSTFHYLGTLK